MIWDILHIIDILLWIIMAASIMYVCFYAFVSLFRRKDNLSITDETPYPRFLVLFPAYNEDKVIVNSVEQFVKQDYPKDKYQAAVISDHMTEETNQTLRSLPITVLTPTFEKSSKAKALQYAINHFEDLNNTHNFDYVVILDADNVVNAQFLRQLSASCAHGYKAIQCHRCAKNSDNNIAILDGVNNTLFRRAHNAIGLSSALIGSGMCFDYQWFKEHVGLLNSAVEDREMEAMLMKEKVYVRFENTIPVFDEKVSNSDNFQRQRLRWMTGQVQTFLLMFPYIPKAIVTGNVNYIDKTIQQALIPRSVLIVCTLFMALLLSICVSVWCFKWWLLFGSLCLCSLLCLPVFVTVQYLAG